jgi:orotate phosphoribosyltransferase
VGAIPLLTSALYYAREQGVVWEGFFVRKEAKAHGLQKRIEGVLPKDGPVVLVEDVVTSGESLLDAYRALLTAGVPVAGAIVLVDRLAGTREKFEALDLPFRSFCTVRDLGL